MKKFNFSQDTVPTVDTINTLSKPHKGELQLLICYINHEAPKILIQRDAIVLNSVMTSSEPHTHLALFIPPTTLSPVFIYGC